MPDVAIRVDGLSKRYRIGHGEQYLALRDVLARALRSQFRRPAAHARESHIWALKDLSFEVKPGEVVGVIGRNGAGKSTLLKILSRITRPTAGRAEIHGRVGSLLEVGTGFHPELTGRENIYLNGALLGMKKADIDRKFDEIVAFAEVEQFLDTPVKHYSSGMYMRLAFAIAAHLETEILLVDEVLAVGDAAFQKKCIGKMDDVARKGRTVMFVSHNMAAIQQLCRSGLLMESGRLGDQGPTEEVVGKYLSGASDSKDGIFKFSKHIARGSGCAPIIREMALLSRDGVPTTRFYTGDEFVVELSIEPQAPIRRPRIALAIEDSAGRRITTVASYFQDGGLQDIDMPCRVRCAIRRLPLGSGRFLLSVSIADKHGGWLDNLENAAWFEVCWRNNYGNGEPYLPVYGPVLTPATWERLG